MLKTIIAAVSFGMIGMTAAQAQYYINPTPYSYVLPVQPPVSAYQYHGYVPVDPYVIVPAPAYPRYYHYRQRGGCGVNTPVFQFVVPC